VKKYLPHAEVVIATVRERYPHQSSSSVKPSVEVAFHVTSKNAEASVLAGFTRGHWAIENVLHRSLDVVLHEDATRVAKSHAAENLATLRRVALATIREDSTIKGTAPKKMRRATFNDDYRTHLIIRSVS
jgi:predicted transposase YbfD/YdcC